MTARLFGSLYKGRESRVNLNGYDPLLHGTNILKKNRGHFSNSQFGKPTVIVHNFLSIGLLPYTQGWAWQQTILLKRLEFEKNLFQSTVDDHILFFQHNPVYTLGRGADESNLTFLDKKEYCNEQIKQKLSRKSRGKGSARLSIDKPKEIATFENTKAVQLMLKNLSDNISPVIAPNGVPIYRIERGGEVTFHGPGQLVVYPLISLRFEPYKQDLHWYLRMVEEVVIETLLHFGIIGERDEENTGVFVEDNKIAAVGVSASKWITTHGFAINVSPELSFFDTSVIIPCGITGKGVTSIAEIMTERGHKEQIPSIEKVAEVTKLSFERVFGVNTSELDTNR